MTKKNKNNKTDTTQTDGVAVSEAVTETNNSEGYTAGEGKKRSRFTRA